MKATPSVLSILWLAAATAPVWASPVHIKDPAKRKSLYKALAKGQLTAAAGKWEDSRKAYREAVRIAPEQVEGHHGYQDAMAQLGRRDELVELYRDKLKRQPGNPLAYYLLGRVVGDLAEREKLLKEAARLDPKSAWAQYALGHLYEHQERWDESQKAFEVATGLRPTWAEGHHALGFCLMQQGKDDQADAAYREALSINPRYVDSLVNLGYVALRRKKYGEAIGFCQKALVIDKNNPNAHNNLGKAYYYQGRLREAVKAYKAALGSDGLDKPQVAYLNIGFCYYRMREWAQCAAAYERAVSIDKNFAYGFYCLAQARYRQELYPKAWDAARRAQALGYKVHERFLTMLRAASPEPKKR